jgi:hypothetical protein
LTATSADAGGATWRFVAVEACRLGFPGVPRAVLRVLMATAVINGVRVQEEYSGILYDRQLFGRLLTEIKRDPGAWVGF